MGNFRHNRVQCFYDYHQVLRSHKCNPDRSRSEKVFHQRLGRRSLRSTRFDIPSNNRGRSSSWPPTNQRSRSKSRETRICKYCKKPGHIKADYRLLRSKTNKAQRADQRSNRMRKLTTSALQPRYWRPTRTFCPLKIQSNQKFYLRLRNRAHGS